MPTDYRANGITQYAGMTWDDTVKWLVNQLPTGRLVIVKDSQKASPYEAISCDATTGAVTLTDVTTNTSMTVPTYLSGALPSATTVGRIIYTTDDGNLRVSNGAAWIILGASGGGGGVTAAANLDLNQLIIGSGGTAVQKLGTLGTTTTVLHGNAAGAPTFGAVSLTADVSGTLPIGNGGLGVTTLTNHGIVLGQGGSAVTATAAMTNGQLPIGSTGADPVLATLTAGTGISVTNAAGSITIANTATGAAVYDRAFNQVITNTGVETSLYDKTVAGNTLGSTQKFQLTLLGRVTDTDATGGTFTFTVKVKFGGTTLATWILTTAADDGVATHQTVGTNKPFQLVAELQNLNATNSQACLSVFDSKTANASVASLTLVYNASQPASGAGSATPVDAHTIIRGTSAVDTTAAQHFIVTGQWSTGSASRTFTADSIIVVQF